MADHTQRREEFIPRLQACMDGRGWNLTVTESAGFEEPFVSGSSESGRATADRDECLAEQGVDVSVYDNPLTEAHLRTMYAYDLDTYHCLLARGVGLEHEAPSVETYVEEALASQAGESTDGYWWGYLDPVILAMRQSEVAELHLMCPERWVFASLS